MPVYDYECPSCGPFAVLRSMSEFELPHDCPGCGSEAPRAILVAPAIAGVSRARRIAIETNERSSHEPRKSSAHGPGCGCCSGRKATSQVDGAAAMKSFPSARPWMISH